jgi:hypothetical protein
MRKELYGYSTLVLYASRPAAALGASEVSCPTRTTCPRPQANMRLSTSTDKNKHENWRKRDGQERPVKSTDSNIEEDNRVRLVAHVAEPGRRPSMRVALHAPEERLGFRHLLARHAPVLPLCAPILESDAPRWNKWTRPSKDRQQKSQGASFKACMCPDARSIHVNCKEHKT